MTDLKEVEEIALEIIQKLENKNLNEIDKKILFEAAKLSNEEQLKFYKNKSRK